MIESLNTHRRTPVGAKLARERGLTFSIDVDYQTAFASKLRSYRGCGDQMFIDRRIFPDKNTRTLYGAMIGVNCAQACEEFP